MIKCRIAWLTLMVACVRMTAAEQTEPALPPLIETPPQAMARIDAVLVEMDRNYGGTLVCDPKDAALDSSAFVQRFLRRFSEPKDLKDYDYRFDRLLDRIASFPESIDDPQLDGDVWASYRAYERVTQGASTYVVGDTRYNLDSARDLLWTYLGVQGARIKADNQRRLWWIDRLAVDAANPVERMMRTFALLQLIAAASAEPYHALAIQADPKTPIPAGEAGLSWFADRLGVAWNLWGVVPVKLPAPRVDEVNLSGRLTQFKPGWVVDQESWSAERQYFMTSFWIPIGRRSRRATVRMPEAPSSDGLFFFMLKDTLHVWPKARLSDGALRMLEIFGFVDADGFATLVRRTGGQDLPATSKGAAPAKPATPPPDPVKKKAP